MANSKKVILIGWDAADWKVINPLIDTGVLPNVQNLIENGVMSDISTLHPVLSPMLWTSIATGKRPYKHGIHGFAEPTADGQNVRPITNLSRKTKAVWNVLNQNGYRSLVVGWWPSHPAEPINGVMVSNEVQRFVSQDKNKPWPLRPGTIFPPELSDEIAEFRFHPGELDVDQEVLRSFVPQMEQIDQDVDGRLWMCAKVIAEAVSIQGVATHLLQTQEWDFAAIYFDAIDHFSHGFMKYHPPRQNHVSEKDFELYKHVIECGYVFHDMMLGSMLKLAADDTTVILMSDHGFHPDHLRPAQIPSEPAGPAIEHRDFGIFAMKGPGIKKDKLIHGVNLLDITPTVLHLFDLPVGADMDGRVLVDAFENAEEIQEIESWDDVAGDDGQHPLDHELDKMESEESLQQLVALGYIEPLDADRRVTVRNTRNELNYNLARSYMDAGRYGNAVELLFDLYQKSPTEYRYGIQLAMCFKSINRVDELDQLVRQLRKQRVADAKRAAAELEKWKLLAKERHALRTSDVAFDQPDADATNEATVELSDAFDKKLFSEMEQGSIRKLSGLAQVNRYALDYLEGFSLFGQGKYDDALALLTRTATKRLRKRPAFCCLTADVYLKMERWDEAEAILEIAYAEDPNNQNVLLGLGQTYLGLKQYPKAIKFLRSSISKSYYFPIAHHYLGVAHASAGEFESAVSAFKTSCEQNPNNAVAYTRLAQIFKNRFNDEAASTAYLSLAATARAATRTLREQAGKYDIPEFNPARATAVERYSAEKAEALAVKKVPSIVRSSADDVKRRIENNNKDVPFVTIVTGLPRTGTSMMMQMLQQGGIPAFTDGRRTADENNPHGYLEHDAAKLLANENRWMLDTEGFAVKIISQLLQHIPRELNYRVIFMDRPMPEILASQKTMLANNKAQGGNLSDTQLQNVFQRQLGTAIAILKAARIPVLPIKYNATIHAPQESADAVNAFLNADLDIDAMANAVDKSLYRHSIDNQADS